MLTGTDFSYREPFQDLKMTFHLDEITKAAGKTITYRMAGGSLTKGTDLKMAQAKKILKTILAHAEPEEADKITQIILESGNAKLYDVWMQEREKSV